MYRRPVELSQSIGWMAALAAAMSILVTTRRSSHAYQPTPSRPRFRRSKRDKARAGRLIRGAFK